jgi:5-methylcytosine-specific restriction endonuclease McrA
MSSVTRKASSVTNRPGRTDTARWRKARDQAIRDAQGACQLCGRDLDPRAPKNTPNATEVDHILPLAMGGDPYARENLRALHRWCHQRRDQGQQGTQQAARRPIPAPAGDWSNGCPDSHQGQSCYTTGPICAHSRDWS